MRFLLAVLFGVLVAVTMAGFVLTQRWLGTRLFFPLELALDTLVFLAIGVIARWGLGASVTRLYGTLWVAVAVFAHGLMSTFLGFQIARLRGVPYPFDLSLALIISLIVFGLAMAGYAVFPEIAEAAHRVRRQLGYGRPEK